MWWIKVALCCPYLLQFLLLSASVVVPVFAYIAPTCVHIHCTNLLFAFITPTAAHILFYLFILVGERGNASCTIMLRVLCVGLYQGLPVGLFAYWTVCPAVLPTKTPPLPLSWLHPTIWNQIWGLYWGWNQLSCCLPIISRGHFINLLSFLLPWNALCSSSFSLGQRPVLSALVLFCVWLHPDLLLSFWFLVSILLI